MRETTLITLLFVGSFSIGWLLGLFLHTKKIQSILTGWYNVFFKDKKVESMARKRAKHCAECPHAVKSKFGTRDKIVSISGKICNQCGCNLSAKLRSPFEECPLTPPKWEEVKL